MRTISVLVVLFVTTLLFQYCNTSKKAAKSKAANASVTYEGTIRPIIQANCTPCHIAGKGQKIALDSYEPARAIADEIIARIQKQPGERGFMPVMHPRLSDSTIDQFVKWKAAGLVER